MPHGTLTPTLSLRGRGSGPFGGWEDAMEQRLDVLTQRLDRLSRENRRYRRVAVGALILGCAALLMGQVAPPGVADEVRARRFLLVDDRGGTRAALTVAPDGSSRPRSHSSPSTTAATAAFASRDPIDSARVVAVAP